MLSFEKATTFHCWVGFGFFLMYLSMLFDSKCAYRYLCCWSSTFVCCRKDVVLMMAYPQPVSCHGKSKFLSVVNHPIKCECVNFFF